MWQTLQGLEIDGIGRVVGGPRFGVRSGVGANDPMDGLGHVRGRVGQITRMIGKSVKKASKQVFQKVGCSQVERGDGSLLDRERVCPMLLFKLFD